MRILPILFNAEMVKAILEGRKTVTRRCIKLPKWIERQNDGTYTMFAEGTCYEKQRFENIAPYLNKPYRPGDILYVRETWTNDKLIFGKHVVSNYHYKADGNMKVFDSVGREVDFKWKPSLHMPKEAARIFLKVKDVRLERLQDICNRGTPQNHVTNIAREGLQLQAVMENYQKQIDDFKQLWNSTIKKSDCAIYGWDANPWVWVVEFERCEKPEGV